MPARHLRRTLGFGALYVVAASLGRLTVVDGANLSLVWPAAGVATVWFMAQRRARTRVPDAIVLAAATLGVNLATGAGPALAAAFVVANLAQVAVFLLVIGRLCPELWGAGGCQQLTRTGQLWRLLVAAVVASAVSGAIGPSAVLAAGGTWSWTSTAVWLTRNTVSIVVVTAVGIRLGALIAARPAGTGRRAALSAQARRFVVTDRWRALELVALLACSSTAYSLVFGSGQRLPLAFLLLVLTLWAATRLPTTLVAWHDLLTGTSAVLLTLAGRGPFAAVQPDAVQALVAQSFVGTVAVVGLALALGRDERTALLAQAAAARDAATAQAATLATIVDSMAEGLAVVGADGRFVLRNPASRRLLGGVHSTTGGMGSATFYGLCHPDGTPLVEEQMPVARVLRGEVVHDVDLLVRNPGVPGGRLLAVSAVALPPPAEGAVVVFRDVTTERAHQAELAAFAGVVAHDLLNPLTVVDGWVRVLDDELVGQGAAPDGSPARDALDRVQRAATRMRSLIDDLLAHTTARDGALRPERVDLDRMAREVADARTDLPPAGRGGGRPRIRVGVLPAVQADPALVRQLLDNLIGNAVKYARPGEAAQVDVVVGAAGPGWARIEVVDRGIGIPAGQHAAVFEDFHRAHRGSGYTGSGLGLAICRRVVERHGGTIEAQDAAGGGTRVSFTLPLAAAAPAPAAGARA